MVQCRGHTNTTYIVLVFGSRQSGLFHHHHCLPLTFRTCSIRTYHIFCSLYARMYVRKETSEQTSQQQQN